MSMKDFVDVYSTSFMQPSVGNESSTAKPADIELGSLKGVQ